MKKDINKFVLLGGTALVFVVYSICLLLLSDLGKQTLWIGFVFTIAAFLLGDGMMLLVLKDPMDAKEFVYQSPVMKLVFAHDIIAMLIGVFLAATSVSWKTAHIIEIIVLAFFLIADVYTMIATRTLSAMQQEKADKTTDIRMMENRLKTIARSCTDTELSGKISRLAEDVHFSDPMSNDSVARLDRALYEGIGELQKLVDAHDTGTALGLTDELSSRLKTRNAECKISHNER
jgi:ABC-type multidrug transport system fused ATPase/permease subunit